MSWFVAIKNRLSGIPRLPVPGPSPAGRIQGVRDDWADLVRWNGKEREFAEFLETRRQARFGPAGISPRARNGGGPSYDPEEGLDRLRADYLRFLVRKRVLSADVRAFAKATMDWVNRRCDGVGPRFYRAAGIDKTTYSKIVSHPESYRPSKDTVLRMALAFQLSLEDATSYLGLAGFALSSSIPADRVWAACFERGVYRREEVESLLAELG